MAAMGSRLHAAVDVHRLSVAMVVSGLAAVVLLASDAPAEAKAPGQTYCFHGVCHRVLTLEETQRAVGRAESVIVSFYDHPTRDKGNPSIATSSGERFDANNDRTAASPIYPNGTRLLLWNAKTKAAAEVRVTNSGPYHGARRLDVSRGAAERLGFRPIGVSQLSVTVLSAPSSQEARYVKGRTYAPAAGYLGVFDSAGLARAAVGGGGNGPTAATATVAGAKPMHTGSVGWDKTVKPVRPPLHRHAPVAAHRPTPVVGTAPGAPPVALAPGWAATLIESPAPVRSRPSWPAAAQPPNALTLRPNSTP